MKARVIIQKTLFVSFGVLIIWYYAQRYFHPNWGWPVSLTLGAIYFLVLIYVIRRAHQPAPFQLVLRMANDRGGDQEDARTFDKLHMRFKQLSSKRGGVFFDGVDTDGCWTWFYFKGPDDRTVRDAIMPLIQDCKVHDASYFLSGAKQPFGSLNDGCGTPLKNFVIG